MEAQQQQQINQPPHQQQLHPQQPQPNAAAIPIGTAAVTSIATTCPPQISVGTTTTNSPVVIPVSVVPPPEDIYTYVAVKGSLHDINSSVFGLNREEIIALSKRFNNASTDIINGVMIKGCPIEVINCLSKLGYKVICSTGDAEIVWTLQREI